MVTRLKKCTNCEKELPRNNFVKKSRAKDGLSSGCKSCVATYKKEYAIKNKERLQNKTKKYREDNKEILRKKAKRRYAENRQSELEKHKVYYQNNKERIKVRSVKYYNDNKEIAKLRVRKRALDNPDKIAEYRKEYYNKYPEKALAAAAKRRASKLQRTPYWLSKEDKTLIELLYKKSREITKDTGIKHEVDHIHPLAGRHISGLHLPSNLQILSKTMNSTKSNSFEIELTHIPEESAIIKLELAGYKVTRPFRVQDL